MAQSKTEIFAQMARDQPDNEMIWYGLGSEYVKEANWSEAVEALRRVIKLNPNYTAAYQMLGTALANSGAPVAAREAWTEGVAVATRAGAWKARQHMESLLAAETSEGIGEVKESGLCSSSGNQ